MTDLVVFVEERSAGIVVQTIAARIAPERKVIVVEHEGKQDLRRSFPRKIQAWRHPAQVPFVILHDNDSGDCSALKQGLFSAIPSAKRPRTKIRIVMQHLEAWYLGDAKALVAAGLLTSARADSLANSSKFRDPDQLANAKQELKKLLKETGQILLARKIAPHMDLELNTSQSYRLFISTLKQILS